MHITDALPHEALKHEQVSYLCILFDLLLGAARLVLIELFNLLFCQCYLFITRQFLVGFVFHKVKAFKITLFPLERDVKTFGSFSEHRKECTFYDILHSGSFLAFFIIFK